MDNDLLEENILDFNEKYQKNLIKSQKRTADKASIRNATFLTILQEKLAKQPKIDPPKGFKVLNSKNVEFSNTTFWSDLHFGSDLDPREKLIKYGTVEETRRLAKVAQEVGEYKLHHRANSDLNIILAGDNIAGKIHSLAGTAQAEQVVRIERGLAQAIAYLAVLPNEPLKNKYRKIRVYCTTGNHDRDPHRHLERATEQKWDSYGTIIYSAVKDQLSNFDNVEFFIPRSSFLEVPVFNHNFFFSHGDTTLSIGNPGKNIAVNRMLAVTNELNSPRPFGKTYQVFGIGHVHVASMVHLDNGAVFFTNAALIPSDGYSHSINKFQNVCGQWIFESTPEYAMGDSRLIKVNQDTDKDSTLSNIIKPFQDF